jgi:hypothetical protein
MGEHVACIGAKRNTCKTVVAKPPIWEAYVWIEG